MANYLRIGEVAKKLGLNPKTIRYYEGIGLIPSPERRKGGWASAGQRVFTKRDIDRLAFIKQARLLDLSLNQIKELLDAVEEGCCSSARPHFGALLESKLLEIDKKMEALRSLRRNLQGLRHTALQVELNQRKAPTCAPASTDSECVFGESPIKIGPTAIHLDTQRAKPDPDTNSEKIMNCPRRNIMKRSAYPLDSEEAYM